MWLVVADNLLMITSLRFACFGAASSVANTTEVAPKRHKHNAIDLSMFEAIVSKGKVCFCSGLCFLRFAPSCSYEASVLVQHFVAFYILACM